MTLPSCQRCLRCNIDLTHHQVIAQYLLGYSERLPLCTIHHTEHQSPIRAHRVQLKSETCCGLETACLQRQQSPTPPLVGSLSRSPTRGLRGPQVPRTRRISPLGVGCRSVLDNTSFMCILSYSVHRCLRLSTCSLRACSVLQINKFKLSNYI